MEQDNNIDDVEGEVYDEEEEDYIDEDDLENAVELGDDDPSGEGQFMEEEDGDEDINAANIDDIDENVLRISPIGTTGTFTDSVYSVAISGNGRLIAMGSGDETILVQALDEHFKLIPGERKVLRGHKDSVIHVAFNPNSTSLATGSLDGTVRIWSVETGSVSQVLEGPGEIEWIQWHSKSNHVILAGSTDGTTWLWDARNGNCMSVMAGHSAGITCGGFTPSGKRIVTGSADGSVKLWDPNNGANLHTFVGHGFHENGGVVSLSFHPTEPMFASGGEDGTVCVTRIDAKKIIARFGHSTYPQHQQPSKEQEAQDMENTSIESVAFCEVTSWLASGSANGSIKIWDLLTLTCRSMLQHEDAVVKLTWINYKIVSCSADCTIRLWDARAGTFLAVLLGHDNIVLDFALRQVSSTTLLLCSGSDDKSSLLYHLENNPSN